MVTGAGGRIRQRKISSLQPILVIGCRTELVINAGYRYSDRTAKPILASLIFDDEQGDEHSRVVRRSQAPPLWRQIDRHRLSGGDIYK